MTGGVAGIGDDGRAERSFRLGGMTGLLISEGELLVGRGVMCAGGDGSREQLLRMLRIAAGQFESSVIFKRYRLRWVEREGAIELGACSIGLLQLRECCAK